MLELPIPSRPLTYDDLAAMPDDGRRYELIDGMLLVSPAPSRLHQRVVRRLLLLLDPLTPVEWEMFTAPFDVVLDEHTSFEPDLVLARMADLTPHNLPAPPVLAIEVLSPSTRTIDLTTKHARLQDFGCAHYWIVDPDTPSVIAYELVDGHYAEVGQAIGEESLTVDRPFRVEVTPQRLIER
ncbi:Uma2 family endonuclease [Nocardioides sp.]|jgi:Uma2 family endonuclease|uniref:Uma2 family endonuclease n=1 Tax=Nocardioides sp. TaxID=35761 RepID=UPI002C42B62D|nr:Uma2 family endonuclease [Nocardioides sp.]HVX53788.1 Uma2 family endonuclease [Nocardioides sp.]